MSFARRIRSSPIPGAHRRRGFTLTELLVAMAIFIVLMGGLATLFANALGTTLFGYQQQEGFDKARASLGVLERDLASAFTASEYGDRYQFFGIEDGFTFVGLGDDGALQRVTYVLHPNTEAQQFQSRFGEFYGVLHNLFWNQGIQNAGANGGDALVSAQNAIVDLVTLLDTQLDAPQREAIANITQDYADLPLYLEGSQNPTRTNTSAGEYLRNNDRNLYETIVELDIVVRTGSILRYEEPIDNLDDFEVTLPYGGEDNALDWPVIHPAAPRLDRMNRQQPESARLYVALNAAIDPSLQPILANLNNIEQPTLENVFREGASETDLRVLMADNADLVRRLDAGIIESMLRAQRRAIWVRMLAGDRRLPRFWAQPALVNDDPRPRAEAYVITEDIIVRAYAPDLPQYDVLDIPAVFQYTSVQLPKPGMWVSTFNHTQNLKGYRNFVNGLGPDGEDTPRDALEQFDQKLVRARHDGVSQGSLLDGRLPTAVRAQFWLAVPPTFQTTREFRRWFVEEFNVFSSATRGGASDLNRREAKSAT
ncbi:MAG: type II secretion system protein J [Candidatus Hydrogenedentota bacterium]